MALHRNRKSRRRGSRKSHRKSHRKGSRKQRGGEAPVGEYGAGSGINPMTLNLAQGQQFAAMHANQHGGNLSFGPYPGAVQEATVLPNDLVASAKLLPLNQSFDYIRQFGPSSDNPNLAGGKRRDRKGSHKGSRKQRGGLRRLVAIDLVGRTYPVNITNDDTVGTLKSKIAAAMGKNVSEIKPALYPSNVENSTPLKNLSMYLQNDQKIKVPLVYKKGGNLIRWGAGGGARKGRRNTRRNRRILYGGSRAEMNMPMDVPESSKMLISPQMQAQTGLNPEWKLAENPASFDPISTKY